MNDLFYVIETYSLHNYADDNPISNASAKIWGSDVKLEAWLQNCN